MADPIISVEHLSKKYLISHQASYGTLRDSIMNVLTRPFRPRTAATKPEEFWALHDINFEIQPGERIGIIGRNGAGKSTLLKILSQITPPTTGEIRLQGRVASLLEVGTGFHQELTGRENIFLNGAILGMRRKEILKKFDEIVAFAEIDNFLDTPVKRYSSGMYIRLAFAVAAHLDSDILIVDEVLAVGDTQFQQKCLQKMEDVAAHGRTIFFVSHNLPSIQSLCTRVLLLQQGRIRAIGQPANIIQQYLGDAHLDAEKHWELGHGPKNSVAELIRISLQNDQVHIHTTTDDSISVTVDYRIRQANATLGLTIVLYDQQHRIVLSSINNHESQWYGKVMPVGTYRSICTIPGKFLNNGRYYLSVIIFGKNFSDAVTVDEVVGLTVLDGPSVRGDYFGDFEGPLRPQLPWTTHPSSNGNTR